MTLQHFHNWVANKMDRQSNWFAHNVAKWAATSDVFGVFDPAFLLPLVCSDSMEWC